MASTDSQQAYRLLAALDGGSRSIADAALEAEQLDPVLIYATITFLRRNYPLGTPAADSVLGRVAELLRKNPRLVSLYDSGKADPIAQWFDADHDYRAFRGQGEAMLDLLIDKLES